MVAKPVRKAARSKQQHGTLFQHMLLFRHQKVLSITIELSVFCHYTKLVIQNLNALGMQDMEKVGHFFYLQRPNLRKMHSIYPISPRLVAVDSVK